LFWTTAELTLLRERAHDGAAAVADLLGRSVVSVKKAAQRHRVSLRRPGVTCGLVLNQPRDVKLSGEFRDAIAKGRIGPNAIAERMELAKTAEICPACGKRPVTMTSTGWCRPCHLSHLADAQRELLYELEAQREPWQVRQSLKRAKDAAETD
jgi:hypothetical protein